MPASIGVNLRVTGHCRQGGRKYMEDFFSVAYQQTEDERDLEYAFFGIYDGHGGAEAAAFAKERLMESIVRHKNFWSDNDEDVLRAIKLGYIETHYAMWKEQDKWSKTASGLPSTSGTTASIAFIRRGKIYIGHVGDSGIVLGYQEPGSTDWKAKPLTRDHKPECALEMSRIEQCGGKVIAKSGVPRVVWNRPRIGHKGPVRRSTPIDEIPFLSVARSLGDLWSYNSELDEFVVSPDPDCSVIPIDTSTFRCLIFGTDGLYNMLSAQMAVHIVQQAEKHNEDAALSDTPNKVWLNPSKCLVERALELWSTTKIRADNTSVVTLMLDPPGPPRAQVLRNRKKNYADSGLQIMTRYQNEAAVVPPEQKKDQQADGFSSPPKPTESFASLRNKTDRVFVLKPRESLTYDPRVFPVAPPAGDVSKDAELKSLSCFKSVQVCSNSSSSSSISTQKTSRYFESKITWDTDASKEEGKGREEMKSFNCRNSDFESFASTSYLSLQENSSALLSSTSSPSEKCEACCCGKKGGAPPDSSHRRQQQQKYEENIQIHEISSSSSDVDDATTCREPPKITRSSSSRAEKKEALRRKRSPPQQPARTDDDVKRRRTSPPPPPTDDKRVLRMRKTVVSMRKTVVMKCLKKLTEKRAPSRRIRDLKFKAKLKATPPPPPPPQRKPEAPPPSKNKQAPPVVQQKIAKEKKNKSALAEKNAAAHNKKKESSSGGGGRNKRRRRDLLDNKENRGCRRSERKAKEEGGKGKKKNAEPKAAAKKPFKVVRYLRKLRRRVRGQRNK